jgi:hypothetical protein
LKKESGLAFGERAAKEQVRGMTNVTLSDPKNKPAATVDIGEIAVFERSPKYRVRIVARERDGSRFVACVGEMLAKQNIWLGVRTFNVRTDEIDGLIDALQRAKGLLS